MSLLVTLNGANYIIPETNEVGWGSNLDDYLVAIAAGVLQKTGGSFTLTAETDFGATYGLKSAYLKSRASNVASTGAIRLANAETGIVWRNAANNADLALTVDASNQLTFNGAAVATTAVIIDPGLANQMGYYAADGSTISPLTLITASKALVSDANGLPVASTVTTTELQAIHALTASKALVSTAGGLVSTSSVTATELGYVSGVTSAIQTQLNLLAPKASPTFTGTVVIPSPFTLGATSVTTTGTELNYVAGVTSAIQTQLNAKAPTASPNFTGTVTVASTLTVANTGFQIGGNQAYPILQVVQASSTSGVTTTSGTPSDTNLTVSITPKFNTSKIKITALGTIYCTASGIATATLVRNSTSLSSFSTSNTVEVCGVLQWYDSPATTSATTYKVQLARTVGGTANWGSSGTQVIIVEELAQ